METILIQLINSKALKLLQEMEELHLIKMFSIPQKPEKKVPSKCRGKLSKTTAAELHKHINQSRNEW